MPKLNAIPRILVVGSNNIASLESIYYRALSKAGVTNLAFFNTDQPARFVSKLQLPYRVINFALSLLAEQKIQRDFWQFLHKNAQQKYDAIILFKGMAFSRQTLEASKVSQPHAVWININPDDPLNIKSRGASNANVVESLSFFDIYCTWSRSLVNQLKQKGARQVEYLPFGYDPELHSIGKLPIVSNSQKVAFIGTWDRQREATLAQLTQYPLEIGGTNWDRLPKSSSLYRNLITSNAVYGSQLIQITSQAAVSLNLLRPQNFGAHNMRTFEIPSMGGLMLTTRTEEQDAWFPEGSASLMYGNIDELKEQLDWIFAEPVAAERIRVNGHKLAQDHSYTERAKQLLQLMA